MIQFFWRLYLRLTNPSCTIENAILAKNVRLEKRVHIGYGSRVCASLIGKYTFINNYCMIDSSTASIGRFCSIAYGVKIGLGNHPTDWAGTHPFAYRKKYGFVEADKIFEGEAKGETIIGNDVWIGANAIILAGLRVGDGAIIGAHALVTKDVEPYSIVMGIPAGHKRYRFDEKIREQLLKIKWWNWSDEKIKENINHFSNPEELLKRG